MNKQADAVFIGYQEQGDYLKPFPLFNIIKQGHERKESTVSALTLEKLCLAIPTFPAYLEWVEQQRGK